MLEFRDAGHDDLPAIVRLLADDPLGATRERPEEPLPRAYRDGLAEVLASPHNSILVAVEEGAVVGCLQLTIIPGVARLGMRRAQIEAVRVDRRCRGRGLGEALVRHAIQRAKEAGCRLVQLTTDKARGDAHRFYTRLGFTPSHIGMKLSL